MISKSKLNTTVSKQVARFLKDGYQERFRAALGGSFFVNMRHHNGNVVIIKGYARARQVVVTLNRETIDTIPVD